MGGLQDKPLNHVRCLSTVSQHVLSTLRSLQRLRQHMLSLLPLLAAIEDVTAARDW